MSVLTAEQLLVRQSAKRFVSIIADEGEDILNNWELMFFGDMAAKLEDESFVPSPKQLSCLQHIAEESDDDDDYRSSYERD